MIPLEPQGDRLDELLADRALQGLSSEEAVELGRLVADIEAEGLTLEITAAEIELALDPPPFEALPISLQRLVEADARFHFVGLVRGSRFRSSANRLVPWLGWVTAAASLVYALSMPRVNPDLPAPVRSPGLIERLADVSPRPLSHTDHPLARDGGGSLVWSGKRQEGYLAVHGLAEVDPGRGVYQLWIFDASRDERFPIDGGTFTVNDPKATTLVPIHPSLSVRKPTMFAITLEPSGGVVVSDRKRVLLTASLSP